MRYKSGSKNIVSEGYQIQQFLGEHKNIFNEDQGSLYDILRKQQGAQQAQDMEVQNIEYENPHKKDRAPMVEVESYLRLIEAIPS
ncbi:hypothetical protein BB561_006970, partial [Smittium simulii]